MASLFEKYRPQQWSDVVGQDKAIATLKRIAANGAGGRAYFISGSTGTGKTTIARILANELASPDCVEELDAGEVTESLVRELSRGLWHRGLGKGGRAVILNEVHRLKRAVVGAMLTALEPIPEHSAWILTTTSDGAESLFEDVPDAHPLLSRCLPIPLSRRGLAEPFAKFVQSVAVREGLDGRDISEYIRLAKDCRNSCRDMLVQVEAGAMLP